MGEITHYAKIENGRLVFKNEPAFRQKIFDVRQADKVLVKIKYGNYRTIDQNSYMFGGVCDPIAIRLRQDGWNFDSYEVYKFLENKFSKHEYVNEQTGQTVYRVKPLKKLDTQEFADRIEEIRMWASQNLGITIETPAQFYGLTEGAYDDWKHGICTFEEAKQKSKTTV